MRLNERDREKHLCVGREKVAIERRIRSSRETPLRRQRKDTELRRFECLMRKHLCVGREKALIGSIALRMSETPLRRQRKVRLLGLVLGDLGKHLCVGREKRTRL